MTTCLSKSVGVIWVFDRKAMPGITMALYMCIWLAISHLALENSHSGGAVLYLDFFTVCTK